MIQPTSTQLKEAKKLFDRYAKELEVDNLSFGKHEIYVGDLDKLPASTGEIRLAILLLVHSLAGGMTSLDRKMLYFGYILLDSFVMPRQNEKLREWYEYAMSGNEEAAKELIWETRHMMSKERARELLDWEYVSDYQEKSFKEDDIDKMSEEELDEAVELIKKHLVEKEITS